MCYNMWYGQQDLGGYLGILNGQLVVEIFCIGIGGIIMKEITMELVIAGFRFIAENRNLSTNELADGLEKLGCD